MKRSIGSIAVLLCISQPALGDAEIHCTGVLIDVWQSKKAKWPMAVIADEDSPNVCVIDRAGSGHDPLKPCTAGDRCHVDGTGRRVGPAETRTFEVRPLSNVERVPSTST